MNELQRLYEGEVEPDHIDRLGHMNVRVYSDWANHATRALVDALGLGDEKCASLGVTWSLVDGFTRHYAEQLVGAQLVVFGGIIEVRLDGLRVYHELRSRDGGDLSATFVHLIQLQDRRSRESRVLPEHAAASASRARVEWPEHGRPRSTDLDHPPISPTLARVRAHDLTLRRPRTLDAEECDEAGFFDTSRSFDLVWGGDPPAGRDAWTPLVELGGGRTMGYAILENRHVLLRVPRVGTRIQSFSAQVSVGPKILQRRQWVFDLDAGDVICARSSVMLAFDLSARRAMEIPSDVRARLEAECFSDLG